MPIMEVLQETLDIVYYYVFFLVPDKTFVTADSNVLLLCFPNDQEEVSALFEGQICYKLTP